MTDTPERIIARIDYDGNVDGQWLDASAPRPHSFGHYFTEYVRSDLLQSLAAENAALKAEAEVAAARLAEVEAERRMIVSHATMGETDGVGLSINAVSVKITALRNQLYSEANARADAAEADRDRLAAELAGARATMTFLRDTIRQNIVVKPGPHTVETPDGAVHSGPLADFMHELLPNIAEILDRALTTETPT